MQVWRKGFKPIDEYKPSQRGMVRAAQCPPSGIRFLKDGDDTYEECPRCGFLLRAGREYGKGVWLWCPCGYKGAINA